MYRTFTRDCANVGVAAGQAQVHDIFSTTFDIVALDNSACYAATVLVRMRRLEADYSNNTAYWSVSVR